MTGQVQPETGMEKGQRNAVGVLNIVWVAALVLILALVGIIAHVPAIPLGSIVGLIVTAVAIFGKLP